MINVVDVQGKNSLAFQCLERFVLKRLNIWRANIKSEAFRKLDKLYKKINTIKESKDDNADI